MKRSNLSVLALMLGLMTIMSGCVLKPLVIDAVLDVVPTPHLEETGPVATREPTSLEQTTWVLQSLNGEPYFPEVEITLEFHQDNTTGRGSYIRGNAVCNGYAGPIELSDHRIAIVRDEFAVSARECLPEDYSELESLYLRTLGRVERYALEDSSLTLTTVAGETLLVFTPQGEQTEWVLESLNGEPAPSERRVTLTLSEARQILNGYGGCNFYGVPYERDDGRFVIVKDRFSQTAYPCTSQGLMEQEQQYFDLLLEVTNYNLEDNTLILTTERGDTLIFTHPL